MVRKQNPYHGAGQPATGDRFVGRADLVRQLRDTWPPGKRPANVEVLGPHRIGKTSLVKQAMVQTKDETLCFVELTVGTGPGDDLFADMVQQVVQRGPASIVKDRAVVRTADQVAGAPHWNAVVTPVRDFFELVSEAGLRVVLVLDSFDNARHTLGKHHYVALKQLCSSVGVVTLSRRPVVDIEGRAMGSEFFLMFNLDHRVGLLDDAEVDLMLARAEPLGIELRSIRGQLVDRAGHHPYLLDLLCYRIIDGHLNGQELNVETAFRASQTTFFNQFDSVVKLLGEKVDTDPVVLLQQVAAGKPTNHTTALEDVGLLRPGGNGSRLFSTSFEEYVYQQADTATTQMPTVLAQCDAEGLVAASAAGRRTSLPELPPGPWRDLLDIIGRLRRARALSGRQVAKRAGLSSSYVSEILNRRKPPSPNAADQLVRALGADEELVLKARKLAEEQSEIDAHRRRMAREGRPTGHD